jgi:hypothetical protein
MKSETDMNNFLIVSRMLQIIQSTKSEKVKAWAIKQGKQALMIETTLNPIR